ncbi:NAD(P)H-binding protein [Moheibacter stercoris]|uniref:Uncharacterized protein YbjT (DUF2867 family) n=1 Tax=Moheibacter stercoris TaxID=1628251 RepID=A0ABV2LWM2_9FLAO
MKAIVIGATGATGKEVVDLLLKDVYFTEVILFVRRTLPRTHEKLTVYEIDFDNPSEWQSLVQGDVLFSCLGTTLKAAGSKEAQWKIDHDYQLTFAQIAKQNGVSTYVLVSSAMAHPDSSFFYMKLKGKLEEAVKALDFERTLIFQPPSLIRENSDRLGEKFGVKILQFLNQFGIAKKQKPLHTKDLAASMVEHAKGNKKGLQVFTPKALYPYVILSATQ